MASTVGAQFCTRLVSENIVRYHQTLTVSTTSRRTFQTSSLLRRSANYPGHVPLSTFESVFLTAGSAFMAFMDPRRGGRSLKEWLMNSSFDMPRYGGRPWRNNRRFYIAKVA